MSECERHAFRAKRLCGQPLAFKARTHDVPMTAGDEERARRKSKWEAEQARRYYEELVLRKPRAELVQISPPQLVETGKA